MVLLRLPAFVETGTVERPLPPFTDPRQADIAWANSGVVVELAAQAVIRNNGLVTGEAGGGHLGRFGGGSSGDRAELGADSDLAEAIRVEAFRG